jgi:hypothetical protein
MPKTNFLHRSSLLTAAIANAAGGIKCDNGTETTTTTFF